MRATTISHEGVWLGATQRGRGVVGGRRSSVEWLGMVLAGFAAIVAVFAAEGDLLAMWPALVFVGLGYGLCTPFSFLRDRSIGAWAAVEGRHLLERHSGAAIFSPRFQTEQNAHDAHARPSLLTKPGRAERRRRRQEGVPTDLPSPVGRVRPLRLPMSDGSELVFLRHSNERRVPYLSVVLEMVGERVGIADQRTAWSGHEGWSRFTSALAVMDGSFITRVQQVVRVVPHDSSDHIAWVAERTPVGVHQLVRDSYVQLLNIADEVAIQHRAWLVLAMPLTTSWNEAARAMGKGDRGHALLALQEMRTAQTLAADCGFHLRPLSEARTAAVFRALQDPDAPIDDLRLRGADHPQGRGGLVDWKSAWCAWDARDRDHVLVSGRHRRWYTRTAMIPACEIEAVPLDADFLRPLLVDVDPQVIRTISTVQELIPAARARDMLLNRKSQRGSQRRTGSKRTTDGAESIDYEVASRVVDDVRRGSRAAGTGWLLTITFQADSLLELQRAARAIQSAATRARVKNLRFLRGRHDLGLAVGLPLARGLRKVRRFGL